jgi:hypothetical protein
MKTKHVIAIGLIVAIGFAVARWSSAQTNSSAKRAITGDNNPAMDRLVALVSYLDAKHDTNGLNLFNEYAYASIALNHSAEMGTKLHVLKELREGKTNDAIRLLEITLDGDIVGFAFSYKELPQSQKEWLSLIPLSDAQSYREKFPSKDEYGVVKKAFEVLDEKGGK